MNTFLTPHPTPVPSRFWGVRRWGVAVIAYCSVVFGSVAAAAALVNAGVPVEALITVF